MDQNRPKSREKHVTDNSQGVHRRGSGTGTGPVGKKREGSSAGSNGSSGQRAGGGGGLFKIIILLAVFLLGGGGGAASLLGGGGSATNVGTAGNHNNSGSLPNLVSMYQDSSVSSGWNTLSNTSKLDTSVAKGARAKRTVIKGNGKDVTTIMVYMCGTDLESRSGMATNDIKEMLAASFDDHINLILYTGGCSRWKNNVMSSQTNQIYQIKDGNLYCLEKNAGNVAMTDPATLTSFIKYCTKNFPANRNDLIFWDHGGGSVSGYGYDEKFQRNGSMNLAGIDKALKNAGTTFDFIGFDACLMATMENALMLTDYADYLIASEETEPGVGWYYTNWLTEYGKDPSRETLQIGKRIVDDFVDVCAQTCRGQLTTLSVIDLAELEKTVPEKLTAFSSDTSKLIKQNDYAKVAKARSGAREFATSTKIDQVDLVHLAQNLGTDAGKNLSDVLLSAVKYNRTSSNMSNAYGISIYFPSKKLSTVNNAVSTYKAIGMDSEYSKCIQEFASMQVAGQSAAGGSSSPYSTLSGGSSSSGDMTSDALNQLLGALLSGGMSNISGLDAGSLGFFSDRSIGLDEMSDYVAANQFDTNALVWTKSGKDYVISMNEDQWDLVTDLEMNMFYDDGEGYVDLGCDNLFGFDEDGNLIGSNDKTWLAINGQPVAYYHTSTQEDGDNYTISGYVPAMLNDQRVNLILVFDQDNPYGYIAGAQTDYREEVSVQAKALTELEEGDTLDFLCDFYSYDGQYEDSYYLGEPMTVTKDMEISNVSVGDGDVQITYQFTDIYGQKYWTPVMP